MAVAVVVEMVIIVRDLVHYFYMCFAEGRCVRMVE